MQQYDDYSSYPDGEYYKALLDDDIASTTENEFNPYSSIDDKNYAFTSIGKTFVSNFVPIQTLECNHYR